MKSYAKFQSTTSIPSHITGGWIAKQPPERQLAAFVAAAARQTTIDCHTHKQLAAMANMSVPQFREARRQHGAPIRPRKRRVPAALPTPAISPAKSPVTNSPASVSPTILPMTTSPAIPPVTASSASTSTTKLPTAQQVADLIAALQSIGSGHLFNAALIAEHDEQIARPLNGAASHTS